MITIDSGLLFGPPCIALQHGDACFTFHDVRNRQTYHSTLLTCLQQSQCAYYNTEKQSVTTDKHDVREVAYAIMGLPYKVSHHQERLIVLKPVSMARFFINFDYEMSTRIQ